MVRFASSLGLVACFTPFAAADIPPPPPEKGFKRVPYEISMKLDKEVPGYKFYPFQRLGIGGQEKIGDELKLGTEAGVVVPSSSSPSVRTGVVAVPAKVMDELKTKESLAKLLSRENKDKLPAGVVVYETRGTIRDLKDKDPRTKVENVVTISLDDKAGVKFTANEIPEPTGKEPTDPMQPPLALLIAGIAAALAVVTLGVWLFRQKHPVS
ncbi:MAG TPA: hypothetical protein VHR66_20290 [Gemmataceae bacterium]|jgi:hypothetical protein|nr:hypothetical protein [Gemmataceae bacterium]